MRHSFTPFLALPLTAVAAMAQAPAMAPLSPLPSTPATLPATAPAVPVAPVAPATLTAPVVDYPGAIWAPAIEGNFDHANRPADEAINMVVVHDIEGPASAAISIFQSHGRPVSAHYVVSDDGTVYQAVREHDIAFHAGNHDINHHAIGIETHGYAYRPGFYNALIYSTEAKLIRNITTRYSIPRDRTHIIGHFEVPNPKDPTKFGGANGHTDPGPYWDWTAFMTMIRNDAQLQTSELPGVIHPGEVLPASVTMVNTGDDPWPANTADRPNEGYKADGPVVYLGTTGQRKSVLSSLSTWISPLLAAGVQADVAPGGTAQYNFSLTGPRQLGDLTEELQLCAWGSAVSGRVPVSFGDTVKMSMTVVPWVIDSTTPDAAPTPAVTAPAATSPTATAPVAPAPVAPAPVAPAPVAPAPVAPAPVAPAPVAPAPTTPAVATWTTKLPLSGLWAVYVSPAKPAKVRKNESFDYSIGADATKAGPSIKTKAGGNGFVFAGYYQTPEPSKSTAVTVTLNKAPASIDAANAGAVRFIGPYPAAPADLTVAPDLSAVPGGMIGMAVPDAHR